MNTPDAIKSLAPDEIFVFGSNSAGHHVGGAARAALDHFGARFGQGEGIQGRSYAIPTMGTLEETEAAVVTFLRFAAGYRDLRFLVTKIGTGIAGRPVEQIAPLFRDRTPNVILPAEFEAALG